MNRLFPIIVCTIMITGFLVTAGESADDKSCWLEATNSEIFLTVWDLDSAGNEMVKIYQGLLEPGDKKKLVASDGKIRYYTNISGQSNSAGVDEMCKNSETISLP